METKHIPYSYDAENGLVIQHRTDDPESVGGPEHGSYFVKRACDDYLCFGENEKLLWAIENALPQIMESELARNILADLVRGNVIGSKPRLAKNRDRLIRDNAIYREVWELIGEGYPAYVDATDTSFGAITDDRYACGIVAAKYGLSVETVKKLFKELGGKNPEGVFQLIAQMSKSKGVMRKRQSESEE